MEFKPSETSLTVQQPNFFKGSHKINLNACTLMGMCKKCVCKNGETHMKLAKMTFMCLFL